MQDDGFDLTQAILQETERDIRRLYARARHDARLKLEDYLAKFAVKDQIKRKQVQDGKITKDEYTKWRHGQMCIGQRWQELVDTLAEDYTNADKIAMSIVNGHMPDVYAINHNYATFQVEKSSHIDTSYTLYDRHTVERLIRDNPSLLPEGRVDIPKDKRWNQTHLKDAIVQGVLQGERIPSISKRLQKVTDMDNTAALRNARTMITGAQNAGRVDSYKRAQGMGINLEQEWLATLDGRTRHSHRQMDGVRIRVGGKFPNGCRYPGDPDGPPHEVYNCRCTLVPVVEGIDQSKAPRNSKLSTMTYEEWKNEHVAQGPVVQEKSYKDIVAEIQQQLNGAIASTEQIMRAGEALGKEYDKFVEEERVRWDKWWSGEKGKIDKEIADTEAEMKLIADEIRLIDETTQDVHKRNLLYKEYNNLDSKLRFLRGHRDLVERYTFSVTQERNVNWLFDILSQVREMGSDGLGVKKHLNNSRSSVRKHVEHAYAHYPKSWVEASIGRGNLTPKSVDRGYYNDYSKEIAISGYNDNDKNATAFHELGHRFEKAVPGILDQEKEFYNRRTAGENLQWLGPGYRRDEETRKDQFIHPYMGKDYGGDAYELVSMGFEYAYTSPEELAKDKDMQSWIYGLLSLM